MAHVNYIYVVYGMISSTFAVGPISLCIDSFVFISVYFVCFFLILHICRVIVNVVGGPDGIETLS